MDALTLSLFTVLELMLLLGVVAFFFRCKNRQLQQQLEASDQQDPAPDGFASVDSGYLPYLEQQILDTRDRMALSESEAGADEGFGEALGYRLELLEAEKQVAELCNDYPERRWEHVLAHFQRQRTELAPAELEQAEPDGEADNDALALAQHRIKRLEKFREHFFETKKQLAELEQTRCQLTEQLEALLPEAAQSKEMQALVATLNEQNVRLQDRIGRFETQAEHPTKTASNEPGSGATQTQRIKDLHGMFDQQSDVIQVLKQMTVRIKQDPQAELVERLEQQLNELERRYREATTCIEIMRQENERLQDRIERKDQRIDRVEIEKNESVADLREQIDKQKRSMSDLHTVVDNLQLEAAKAAELQSKLDQFDLVSRDMNMCVQVLEEENEFLQAQIRSLLQLDERDSLYAKQELTQNMEAAEKKIDALQAQLKEKDQKVKEAEGKFAAMEQEYLTLYEESQS